MLMLPACRAHTLSLLGFLCQQLFHFASVQLVVSNASEGVAGIAERDAHPTEIESLLLLHNVVVLMPVYPASWSLIRSFLLSLSMRCHQTVLCYSPPLPFSFVVMLIWFYLFIYRRFSQIIF